MNLVIWLKSLQGLQPPAFLKLGDLQTPSSIDRVSYDLVHFSLLFQLYHTNTITKDKRNEKKNIRECVVFQIHRFNSLKLQKPYPYLVCFFRPMASIRKLQHPYPYLFFFRYISLQFVNSSSLIRIWFVFQTHRFSL